ncbi:MAG: radical SAM protein [Candidatus Bathyarchaeia archaeon]
MLRSDVWDDEAVRERLSWYYAVLRDLKPAKFLICKQIACIQDPQLLTEPQLWHEHERLHAEFRSVLTESRETELQSRAVEKPRFSFLDLKVELLNRILRKCIFCEWRCKVDRVEGKRKGACHLDSTARVATFFRHFGEEPPLVDQHGSGTIFFTSCTFRCTFCLHPSSYVTTEDGPVRVDRLYEQTGDETQHNRGYVRIPNGIYTSSADGRWVEVTKVFKHDYSGPVIVIKPLYAPDIIVTPEHQILAANGPGLPLVKIRAADLSVRHWLAIPRANFTESAKILDVRRIIERSAAGLSFATGARSRLPVIQQAIALSNAGQTSFEIGDQLGYGPSYVRTLRSRVRREGFPPPYKPNTPVVENNKVRLRTEKRPGIPKKLKIDELLAEFLGYYCAEGFISKDSSRPSSFHVVLSFGRHEKSLVERAARLVRELFGLTPSITERRATITVELTKSSLALLISSLCGTSAASKKVPTFLYHAPQSVVQAFLHAYEAGDGCITGSHLSLNTVSRDLAVGLFGLYLKLGHLPSFNTYHAPPETVIEGRRVRQSTLYYVKVTIRRMRENSWQTAKHVRYSFAHDHILVPISRVGRIQYSGPVYNLAVDDAHHSYTANYIAVGNCQNWDISQDPDAGAPVSPGDLSLMIKSLRSEGAANINFVGGEPTPNLHIILEALNLTSVNVPILWNSNMYLTSEAMQILADVVDIWLPDFKWGNDRCALKYSRVVGYFEAVSRNHAMAHENGDMIVRHLVMPGHVECCTKPILDWIAENCPRALVNVMSQYRPEHLVLREPEKYREIARCPSTQEIREARAYADQLGLVWKPVS